MVLLVPMLKALQQRYGRPCEVVSSGPWTAPLLARVPSCGRLHLLTSRRAPYLFNRSQWQLVAALRRRRPGPVYVFESDEKPHQLLRRAGIGLEWIRSIRDCPRRPDEHIVSHALRLAQLTPAALDGWPAPENHATPDIRLSLGEADRRDCTDWLERRGLTGAPLVLIQPGNKKTMRRGDRRRSSNVKYWPEENWAAVIAGVQRRRPAARIILCGSPTETTLARDIARRVPGAVTGLTIATEDLPIPRLLALQERAHSMISVDTGPAHTAAAMGCPVVVLFTHHPLCRTSLYAPVPTSAPVKIIESTPGSTEAGLTSITPDVVLSSWHSLPETGERQRAG
jgi:heptosyltransferase-2/heptosyltransferase-3